MIIEIEDDEDGFVRDVYLDLRTGFKVSLKSASQGAYDRIQGLLRHYGATDKEMALLTHIVSQEPVALLQKVFGKGMVR